LIIVGFARIEGETKETAAVHMAIAQETALQDEPVKKPACILSGGETTVTIRGEGKGGRSQGDVLAAALGMGKIKDTVILYAEIDGTNGPTDAAGAISDSSTLERAQEKNLDPHAYLENNNSYHFFDSLGDLYKTGPTNTNVMNLRIIMVG
jgi:glycerate 2-kinase